MKSCNAGFWTSFYSIFPAIIYLIHWHAMGGSKAWDDDKAKGLLSDIGDGLNSVKDAAKKGKDKEAIEMVNK